MKKFAFVALWLLVLTIPFENALTLPGVGSLSRLVGLIAIAAGICSVAAGGRIRRPAAFHLGAIAFALWAALTLFWTVDAAASATRAWTYLQVVAVALLIWQLAPDEPRQQQLMGAYVCGAYVSVVWMIVNAITGADAFAVTGKAGYEYAQRYVIIGTDPNDLGLSLALAVPLAWYLSTTTTSRAVRNACQLYAPAALAAIALTASRGSLIALAVALLIIPFTIKRLSGRRIAAIAAATAVAVYATFILIPPAVLARLATIGDEISSGSFSSRGDIWATGLDAFTHHPFLGHGTGAFAEAVFGASNGSVDQVAHNALLSVLVEHGLVGLLVLLIALTFAVLPVLRMKPLARALWIVTLLTLLTGSSALSWEYRKPTWFFLGLLVAHGAASAVGRRSQLRRMPPLSYSVPFAPAAGEALV
jgi:O-antigen ligase